MIQMRDKSLDTKGLKALSYINSFKLLIPIMSSNNIQHFIDHFTTITTGTFHWALRVPTNTTYSLAVTVKKCVDCVTLSILLDVFDDLMVGDPNLGTVHCCHCAGH